MKFDSIPETIAYIGRHMFERRLADMAGGTVSMRAGETIYITSRYSGSRRHWQNRPDDVISGPIETDALLDDPRCSRESRAHLAIYRHFPDVTGVIHAHPFHILPFCVAERPIEPVLEATQKFGVTPVVKGAAAHSPDLATHVVEGLQGREASIRKQAAAVLLPRHGIFVAGKDIFAAIDALERIEWNAWCMLAQSAIPPQPIGYTPPGE